MTKRKKTVIISIAVFCLCCILFFTIGFSIFWFSPYCRQWTFQKTPIETDALLAYPDSVVCRVEGENKWLDDEEIEKLYERLRYLLAGYRSDSCLRMTLNTNMIENMRETMTCIEFRYKQRRRYMGTVLSNESFEYDAMLLVITESYAILPIPYLGCSYLNILGDHPLAVRESVKEFKDFVKEL